MSRLYVKDRFAVIPNSILNSEKISFRAKGIFAFLNSKPDGWKFSANRIAAQSSDGRDSVISALKELENVGILTRKKTRKNGKWSGVDYILNIDDFVGAGVLSDSEEDSVASDDTVYGNSVDGKGVNNSNTDNNNTDNSNKDNSNTDVVNYSEERKEITDYLNNTKANYTGEKGKYLPNSQVMKKYCNARLSEGYTVDDFKDVIDKKFAEWSGTKWEKYLRPSTLFNSEKFPAYLNEPRRKEDMIPMDEVNFDSIADLDTSFGDNQYEAPESYDDEDEDEIE